MPGITDSTIQGADSGPRELQTLETPFLGIAEAGWAREAAMGPANETESPFLSEEAAGDPTRGLEAFEQLLDELYDTEFDEAVADLAAEAEAYVGESGLGETEIDQARAERMLESWIEPLRFETESMLGRLAEAVVGVDPRTTSEAQLDELVDQFEPSESEHGPVFEDFLKKFFNKAKKLARGALKVAKAGVSAVTKILPINLILQRLRGLVRPLLARVLKLALNRLPVQYRDPAKLIARKLFGVTIAESDELGEAFEDEDLDEYSDGATVAQPATASARQIQEAFDAEAAGLAFAPTSEAQDLVSAEAAADAARSAPASLEDLDAARERFVRGIGQLQEGADPTPVVENFLPAILPALRLGVKVAGRPRVVRFLAGYLGRLIAPYVGPTVTPGMSRAIVDAGLRLMTLEAADEAEEASPALAGEAFASLVEDAVTRVAELDEEDLADETLLEEAVYSAFHEAAAANFPGSVLSGESEYLESGAGGTWVPMPRRGPRRYRKYSRVFEVVIDPAAARAIRTFGGRPLSAFLRDRMGRRGPVRARVHLYQAIPGTSASRIARLERGVAGLGPGDRRARRRFHPLTPLAAASLVGEPGLGREAGEVASEEGGPLSIGQRLYYLEVPGAAPVGAGDAAGNAPRTSGATATIDGAAGKVGVRIYVSENDAQAIAGRLRRREPPGAVLATLRRIYAPAIGTILPGRRGPGAVRVASESEDEGTDPEMEDLIRRGRFGGGGGGFRGGFGGFRRPAFGRPLWRGAAGFRRGRRRPRPRRRLLVRWIGHALARELDRNRDAFLAAADAPDDGVTISLELMSPYVGRLLVPAGAPGGPLVNPPAGPAQTQVQVAPGHPRA